MQTIKHKGKINVIIYRDEDWVEGLNFITPENMFMQVGSWWYKKGKVLDKHIHNEFDRVANRTQECVYVRKLLGTDVGPLAIAHPDAAHTHHRSHRGHHTSFAQQLLGEYVTDSPESAVESKT